MFTLFTGLHKASVKSMSYILPHMEKIGKSLAIYHSSSLFIPRSTKWQLCKTFPSLGLQSASFAPIFLQQNNCRGIYALIYCTCISNYVAIMKELQCNNDVDKIQLQLQYVNFILMHTKFHCLAITVVQYFTDTTSVHDNKYAILT